MVNECDDKENTSPLYFFSLYVKIRFLAVKRF